MTSLIVTIDEHNNVIDREMQEEVCMPSVDNDIDGREYHYIWLL